MTIRREDLVAAASHGLLQYRQIDPLLVYLLQRDVLAKRRALGVEARRAHRSGLVAALSYLLAIVLVTTATLFAMVFTARMVQSYGIGALFLLTGAYALVAIGLASWFRKRGYCGRIRTGLALTLAAVPVAVFALQQVGG